MNTLRVLAGQPEAALVSPPVDCSKHSLVWDRMDVAAGSVSLPALLEARLLEIRQELVAFVYDLGRLHVHGAQVQAHLQAGDSLSMWWCSLLFEKHPKVTPDIYPALKLRALELYVEQGKYSRIVLEESPGANKDSRLRTSLKDFCQRTGREFACQTSPVLVQQGQADPTGQPHQGEHSPQSFMARCYYALPAPCKAAVRMAAWLWRVRRHLPRTTAPRPPQPASGARPATATIATYFPNIDAQKAKEGRFHSRYWESLHEALAPAHSGQQHRVNWLFMLFPSPQYSFAECLALRDSFAARAARCHKQTDADGTGSDGASFTFVEEFLYTRDIFSACLRYVRLALASVRLQSCVHAHCFLPGSRMNLWAYLGPYFADSFRGWRCLERCLHQKAFRRYVEWTGPQQWTIFPLENCPWERMLTQAVHEAAQVRADGYGTVWGTQHSTVRPTDFRYFDDVRTFSSTDCLQFQPDRICGNGAGACEAMRTAHLPENRLGMVEALRYMYLAPALASTASTTAPSPDAHAPKKLLIVTSFFADEVADHMRVLAAAYQQGLLQDWAVTLKAHPYLAVENFLERLFPQGHDFTLSTAPIGQLLTAGTVVWASNSTTVALEAAMQGLSVMVQLPANDVDLCPLQNIDNVPRIACAAHVAAALAAPTRACMAADYLALDPALPRWRALLDI